MGRGTGGVKGPGGPGAAGKPEGPKETEIQKKVRELEEKVDKQAREQIKESRDRVTRHRGRGEMGAGDIKGRAEALGKKMSAKTKIESSLVGPLNKLRKPVTKEEVIAAIKKVTDKVFGPQMKKAIADSGIINPSQTPIVLAQSKEIMPLVLSNYVRQQVETGDKITPEDLKGAITKGAFKKALIAKCDFTPEEAVKFFNAHHVMIENALGL